MAQTLTDRLKAIKPTPGSGAQVQVSTINAAFDKFDNDFRPACKIHNNVTQTVVSGSGQNLLQFNQTIFDTYAARTEGPMADLTNDLIRIRKPGLYLVRANVLANAGTAAGILRLDIAINNITANSRFDPATAQAQSQELFGFYILAANDAITAFVQQTTGANRVYDRNTYVNIFNLEAIWIGRDVEV